MGLRNAAIHYRQIEITHIIENLVYLELLRRGYIVDIGKNREREIDFVARELGGRQYYIQVSYTIQDEASVIYRALTLLGIPTRISGV